MHFSKKGTKPRNRKTWQRADMESNRKTVKDIPDHSYRAVLEIHPVHVQVSNPGFFMSVRTSFKTRERNTQRVRRNSVQNINREGIGACS